MKIDYTKFSVLVVLLFIWQLPQILASLLTLIVIHNKPVKYTNEHTGMTVWQVDHSFRACWSMGPFIFVPDKQPERILRHETGHSIQSVFLGPLYLFAVGIPSAILFGVRRAKHYDDRWYYSHYPENWANMLGGVDDSEWSK